MSVSPALAENLAAEVVAMYAEAERVMLARIARSLAKGLDSPQWAELKLAEVQLLQKQMDRLVVDLENRAAAQVALALVKAYNRGGAAAAADLAALLKVSLEAASAPLLGLPAVELLVAETMGYLHATGPRILRSVMDAYRAIISETAGQVLIGTQTRRQAAQAALDRFAARGIRGFVDRAGRAWTMQSYTEMAMRTGCGRAAVQGHTDRLLDNGFDLVIVSDAPQECHLCRPWEGKVLSISGVDATHRSVSDARAGGLFHPNCRHSISAYQKGITKPMHHTADPEGDADRQKLRYLERKVRESKRMEAAAMDEPARKAAAARVRAYQAKIRHHVATTTAKRQPVRERLGTL